MLYSQASGIRQNSASHGVNVSSQSHQEAKREMHKGTNNTEREVTEYVI